QAQAQQPPNRSCRHNTQRPSPTTNVILKRSVKAQEAWVSRLREQASAAVEALASAEDTLAHQYAAHQQPQQAAGHRRHAAQARTAVGVLRAITRSSEADDGTTPLRRPPL
ncbi:hypothetical protein, partial [Streptomyces sp. NPDC055060]